MQNLRGEHQTMINFLINLLTLPKTLKALKASEQHLKDQVSTLKTLQSSLELKFSEALEAFENNNLDYSAIPIDYNRFSATLDYSEITKHLSIQPSDLAIPGDLLTDAARNIFAENDSLRDSIINKVAEDLDYDDLGQQIDYDFLDIDYSELGIDYKSLAEELTYDTDEVTDQISERFLTRFWAQESTSEKRIAEMILENLNIRTLGEQVMGKQTALLESVNHCLNEIETWKPVALFDRVIKLERITK